MEHRKQRPPFDISTCLGKRVIWFLSRNSALALSLRRTSNKVTNGNCPTVNSFSLTLARSVGYALSGIVGASLALGCFWSLSRHPTINSCLFRHIVFYWRPAVSSSVSLHGNYSTQTRNRPLSSSHRCLRSANESMRKARTRIEPLSYLPWKDRTISSMTLLTPPSQLSTL